MTRMIPLFCVLFLAVCATASPAAAKRGGISIITEEMLLPVTPLTDAQGDWVCHLVERKSLAFIPFWTSSRGYVFGSARCERNSYAKIMVPIEILKTTDGFPAHLPDTPRLTPTQAIEGFAGLIGLGLMLAFAGIKFIGRTKRRDLRQQILGIGDGPVFQMVDIMCHAAMADGHSDEREVRAILQLARNLTGLDFQELHITEMLARTDKLTRPKDFRQFARGLNERQKLTILDGALSVILADGTLSDSEELFLKNLALGMGIQGQDMLGAVETMLSRRSDAVPA